MRRLRRDAVVAGLLALTGAPAPAFAEAVVDAAAKPYMVGGGWIVALIFAGLGGFLLRKGISYRRLAEAMSAWQTVEGEVLESTVRKRMDRGYDSADITRYIPQVRYAYKLGGIAREGATIRVGLGDFGYMSEQQAREHAGRYPAGARVAVRCDPQNPDVAVLEAGQVGGGNKVVAGSIFLLLGVCAAVFAIWIAGLAAR
jgi:uncharacterized protein DUF3592